MRSIQSRADIKLLVDTFYERILKDDLLGPIFDFHIAEEEWPPHLEKLTDFWETNLFGIAKFKGSPTGKHVKVDRAMNYGITQEHFGRWLMIWFKAIDDLYDCDLALRAKESARRMANGQFMMVWRNRPESIKLDY